MKLPKAITLDLDDTLWPIGPTIRRAEKAANDWFGTHAPNVLLLFDEAKRTTVRRRLIAQYPDRVHMLSWLRHKLYEDMLERSGDDPKRAEEVFEVFYAARQEVELYPDVRDALARLAACYPIASVSNGNADLARIGLGEFFTFTLSASDTGIAKPDARIYLEACKRHALDPAEVLHVGDDPLIDVIGAQQAGLQGAWINRGAAEWSEAEAPHWTATDLSELADQICPPA